MFKSFLVLLGIVIGFGAYAQEAGKPAQDSVYVEKYKNKWYIKHKVNSGETIFMLARRYHVPPAMLADANGMNYQQGLEKNTILWVPLGAYNRKKSLPSNLSQTRALYYKVDQYDNMFIIARFADVKQQVLQGWNGMEDNNVMPGRVLKVGWVLYDATQLPFADTTKSKSGMVATSEEQGGNTTSYKYPHADTVIKLKKVDEQSKEEKLYMVQTHDEAFVTDEKGTAVFFDMPGKPKSTYYAFHNAAPRGTIIKVFNPGTKMSVFVKVLGPLPNTGQYHNSIIGIASNAKQALGVVDDKLWCELYYYPSSR